MPSLRQQLNPRLHIAATIGWTVFGVVTLAALIAANLASNQAEQRARTDAAGLLAEFATQARDALSMTIETRRSLLQATAAQIVSTTEPNPEVIRQTLLAVQSHHPEVTWLGVSDASGKVVAETEGRTPGASGSRPPGFQPKGQASGVGELNVAPAAAEIWVDDGDGQSQRSIVMAAPIRNGARLVASFSWTWVEQQVLRMQQALNKNRQVELLLVARNGTVLVGPTHWKERLLAGDADPTEGGEYMLGSRAHLRLAGGLGLGWTTIVRQRAELALAPARTTGRTVFLTVFVAGLLAAATAALATRLLTQKLSHLARDAEAVRQGERRSLAVPEGDDEVSRIGATLSQVVDHLQAEKQALQSLNAELDARVAERTLRIERMADEARHSAVTRERLRIARDLHDTLAHSLMALLTQIRLIRKLSGRMDAIELDDELLRAEAVATTGLSESRAAITQMRDNGVRDTGLGAAVQDLIRRFRERVGVEVSLDMDVPIAKSMDERAETAFRIIEEALRNIERHAGARTVRVILRSGVIVGEQAQASIEIADDGVGFDPALPIPGHFGLRGIHEQAAMIDARLDVLSKPGQGTRIVFAFAV